MHIPNEDSLVNDYKAGGSTRSLASKYKISPASVYRILKRCGAIRDKGEARKIALETGRAKVHNKGIPASPETKLKMSQGAKKVWEDLSEEEREYRSQIGKTQWNSLSEEEKEALQHAAHVAIRKASDVGSKMERFLEHELSKLGFMVTLHKTDLIANTKMEIDLFLPEHGIVIEVDGPSHFLPVWGEERLAKTEKADNEKNGLLLSKGFIVIRLRYNAKNDSKANFRHVFQVLKEKLDFILKKPLKKHERLIYLNAI